MKDLRGDAAAPVPGSRSECFQLLAAIERYPEWHPDVIRQAEVTQRDADGQPEMARAIVHLGIGPVRQDFPLVLEVTSMPEREVRLTRVRHDASDAERFSLRWQIEAGPPTRLTIELRARLDVPRLLPLGGVGGSVAQGFLAAAQAELGRRTG